MTLAQFHQNSICNFSSTEGLLEQTYRKELERNAQRIWGDVPEGLVDSALCQMQSRLSEVSLNCDLSLLAFDCLRKEIVFRLKDGEQRSDSANPLLKDYIPNAGDLRISENRRKCLNIVLSLMSGKQRQYFFERYYFLKADVPVNKRLEREIACLFAGKGITVHRFHRYGVEAEPVSPFLYLDCLNNLDPFYFLGIALPYSDACFPRASDISIPVVIAESRIAQFKYFLYAIPLLIIIAAVFSLWVLSQSH